MRPTAPHADEVPLSLPQQPQLRFGHESVMTQSPTTKTSPTTI
ncbi:uncharacterized protein FTOL_05039 [Fusarium torulosum]|uniref:Uncharacterized protein n=1 Tax=Fusarium torulosum TaxID=33205 RepID=A0AAE8M8B9_9HYPO|nr:uncharacterized protein FTOL_05039 [Fusarium torulosum]